MRTVPAALQARLDSNSISLARLWETTRNDGVVVRLTDADLDIVSQGQTFTSRAGFTASSVLSALGSFGQEATHSLSVNPIAFDETDIRSGRWRGASTRLQVVDFNEPEAGVITLFAGRVAETVIDSTGRLEITVQSLLDQEREFAIISYSPVCRADLGDAKCQFDIQSLARNFTVATVISPVRFTTVQLSEPDDFWVYGVLQFNSGDNDGVAVEVATNIQATQEIILFTPPVFTLQIGDTGIIYPGCDKTTNTCFVRYNNIANFRGEPFRVTLNDIDETTQ